MKARATPKMPSGAQAIVGLQRGLPDRRAADLRKPGDSSPTPDADA
jgi:hypothetical protein